MYYMYLVASQQKLRQSNLPKAKNLTSKPAFFRRAARVKISFPSLAAAAERLRKKGGREKEEGNRLRESTLKN